MGGGRADYQQSPEPELTEEEQMSTSQEATPLPWLCGERKVAARWISRVYNQRAVKVKAERPGKK